jgi:hypothetical protein
VQKILAVVERTVRKEKSNVGVFVFVELVTDGYNFRVKM